MSVRDLITEVSERVKKGDLPPSIAAEDLNTLSALIGNILDEVLEADFEYSKVLLKCLDNESKANRAKIVAETSPEFMRRQRARNTKELALEMMRSLKYYLRNKEDEQREANRQ